MTIYRNTAKGIRGILLTSSEYVFLQPGETKSIASHKVRGVPEGVIEVDPLEAVDDGEPLDPPPADIVGDDDTPPAADKPLSDLRRDELERVAKAEGIDLELVEGSGSGGNVLVKDIVAAIQAKRAASANG